jgi:hypothetical protein
MPVGIDTAMMHDVNFEGGSRCAHPPRGGVDISNPSEIGDNGFR